jgi:hypothetical protein
VRLISPTASAGVVIGFRTEIGCLVVSGLLERMAGVATRSGYSLGYNGAQTTACAKLPAKPCHLHHAANNAAGLYTELTALRPSVRVVYNSVMTPDDDGTKDSGG